MQADPVQYGLGSLMGEPSFHTTDKQRHGHIVERSEFAQEVVELVDKAERPISHTGPRAVIHPAERLSFKNNLPRSRGIEASQKLQQGALARPRRTHHCERLATIQSKINRGKGTNLARSVAEYLLESGGRKQDAISHDAMPLRDQDSPPSSSDRPLTGARAPGSPDPPV